MVENIQLVEAHKELDAAALEIPKELKREIQVQDGEHIEGTPVEGEVTIH